jgi:FkbM family methyltransferase
MLFDWNDVTRYFSKPVTGVLHVGAHLAEEAPLYEGIGVSNVWWVEGNPSVMVKLRRALKPYPTHRYVQALVYEEDGAELDFHVTNVDGMSSSIYEFGTHSQFSPDIEFVQHFKLPTKTIDTIVAENKIENINLINLDLQGAELPALKGASKLLGGVDYILTEVNRDEVYKGCTKIQELSHFLTDFVRVETHWVPNQGWGDALFIRKTL